MELLKAQMHELEKLVPAALAEQSAVQQMAQVVPMQVQMVKNEYETPTRAPRDDREPQRLGEREREHERSSGPERSYERPQREWYSPNKYKHGGKPYDRPEGFSKFDKFDKSDKFDKFGDNQPYDKPYGKPYKDFKEFKEFKEFKPDFKHQQEQGQGYSKYEKKPYYKQHHEGGYPGPGSGDHQPHQHQHQHQQDSYKAPYTPGGYKKYRDDARPQEFKPFKKQYLTYDDGNSNNSNNFTPERGGYKPRGGGGYKGGGRGGYSNSNYGDRDRDGPSGNDYGQYHREGYTPGGGGGGGGYGGGGAEYRPGNY
jgi:hypothetical protein